MPRKLTREAFLEIAGKPKRRYHTLRIRTRSRVGLRDPVPAPCYWFERHQEIVEADGSYVIEPKQATVTMVVDGTPSVLFYLAGSQLESCTFTFTLTQQQLAKAAAAMKRAKLAKLIPDAASSALERIPGQRPAALEADLKRLARRTRA